jgi:hypothetical protein
MKSLLSFTCAFVSMAAVAFAEEELTFKARDGREFNKVFVTRVLGRKVELMTSNGIATVRIADLPPELQKRFQDPNLKPPPKYGDPIEFTTNDGRNVKGILRLIAPAGLSIETSTGIEKVPVGKLPPELAETFDFPTDTVVRGEEQDRLKQQAAAARASAELRLAEQRAAQERAAAEAAAQAKATPRADSPAGSGDMGNRGAERLGSPKLGGSGTVK